MTTEQTGVKGVIYNNPLTTKKEVDDFLEAYKAQNPKKYKAKEAIGEFDSLYERAKAYAPPAPPPAPEPTEEEVEEVEQKKERKVEKEKKEEKKKK